MFYMGNGSVAVGGARGLCQTAPRRPWVPAFARSLARRPCGGRVAGSRRGVREGVGYGRVWVWYGGASGCGGGVDGGGTRGVVGT